jgi:hypothetical protein
MLSVGIVKSKINLVLSGKDVSVVINIPEAERSLGFLSQFGIIL